MDTFEYDEKSPCACGKGIVKRHCVEKWYDSWACSPCDKRYSEIDTQCPDCNAKYYYKEFSGKQYLVPKSIEIPDIIEERKIFWRNINELLVCGVTKQELEVVISDMVNSKYSTKVQKSKSKQIIDICHKYINTKSLKKIVPLLQDILTHYEEYKWNPNTIAEYKQQEEQIIKQNRQIITDALSKSYLLDFRKEE